MGTSAYSKGKGGRRFPGRDGGGRKGKKESRFQNLATSSQTRNYNITIIPIIVNLWGIYERIMEIRHF